MDTATQSPVYQWLTRIMPAVVATLAEWITTDTIMEMSQDLGIHGPYSIGIEKLRGPITAINFHFMVAPPAMMMATTATFRDEDYTSPLKFDMVFNIEDFHSEIADETHLQQLVDCLVEQCEGLNDNE